MDDSTRNLVKTAETTFLVLTGIKELDGASLTELAMHLDIPKSTAYSYLSTLEQAEYIVKEDGMYHLGLRFLEYGAHARNRNELYEFSKHEINRLAKETGDLANFMIEEHGRGIYLYRSEGNRAVKAINTQVGTRVYLHSTAMGKAILAHLPPDRVETIIDMHGLPEVTEHTVTNASELRDELDEIRECGYAVDDQELVDGLRCIAAPILDNDDRVRGAVSVSGPTHRFKDVYLEKEIPAKVMETANVVQLNLTYS